ncbi:MAG: hypothetical protein IJ128_05695 [Firmicutes bacterium]|nr:hypothetical protein [Bacillota bacterium]
MKINNDEQMILFCVAKCKQRVSRGLVIEILQGSHSVRVFNRRLNQNSAFGTMKGRSTEEVDDKICSLIDRGLLIETDDEYPRLMLTEESEELLREHGHEID